MSRVQTYHVCRTYRPCSVDERAPIIATGRGLPSKATVCRSGDCEEGGHKPLSYGPVSCRPSRHDGDVKREGTRPFRPNPAHLFEWSRLVEEGNKPLSYRPAFLRQITNDFSPVVMQRLCGMACNRHPLSC